MRAFIRGWATTVVIIILLCVSCGRKQHGRSVPEQTTIAHDRYLLERMSLKLRQGVALSDEEYSLLSHDSLANAVSYFMKDPAFIDMVFDFNLYFLGFKSPGLQLPNGETGTAFGQHLGLFSSAIHAAKEVDSDGDYLTLFDYQQPFYAAPLIVGKIKFDATYTLDFDKERADAVVAIQAELDRVQHLLTDNVNLATYTSLCSGVNLINLFRQFHSTLNLVIYDNDSIFKLDALRNAYCKERYVRPEPSTMPPTDIIPDDIKSSMLAQIAPVQHMLDQLLSFHPDHYKITSVRDFKTIETGYLDLDEVSLGAATNTWFWFNLVNSSTNYNRKRSSYILKRYLCDDLSPIAVEQPDTHSNGDRHASDASCMSCHYKLDPLGGFFRNYGAGGSYFGEGDEISFDDGATKPLAEYVSEWRKPGSSVWNIGLIRSTVDETQNTYPKQRDNPGVVDLFALLRDAPEARQCLVKNLVRYVVDENLTVDGGYLRHLTDTFNKDAEQNSAEAFKRLVATVTLSQSFQQSSVNQGVCYDYAPGTLPDQRPPCVVADVIERNCISCHSSKSQQGGLNLVDWVALDSGFGFQHVHKGKQLTRSESFRIVAASLSTIDNKKRMPLNSYMSPADREQLFRFFSAE